MKKTVLVLVGATGSGKSAAAVALAQKLDGEIVSCDSVSLYKGFDIGSAKPNMIERQGVPHHMIDIADAREYTVSVAAFKSLARTAIAEIHANEKLPILAGGSGLYLDAVLSNLEFAVPADMDVRNQILCEQEKNAAAVFEKLRAADPISAARLHENDHKRIARALEVFLISGKPFSQWSTDFSAAQSDAATYRAIKIGLRPPREELYARINARAAHMLENGLLEETRGLLEKGHAETLPPMQSIGYAQCVQLLRGRLSAEMLLSKIQKATRHYAKRQETWFRRDTEIRWFHPQAGFLSEMAAYITERLQNISCET